ncbi:MAG: SPASM domain-containing protein [Bacillota bacterium]
MRYKASKYNILSQQGDGSWLVFGCLGNGLAGMDERGYHVYQRFVESPTELQDLAGPDREVAERLRQGQIMLPESMDELSFLRATHYRARFSRTGLALIVLPTFECNFACDYCYQGKQATPGVMGSDVQEALVRFASRNLFPGAVLWATWYGGEPLLFVVEPDGTLQKCWNAVGQPNKAVGHVFGNQTAAHDVHRANDAKWLGWDPFVGECPTCSIFPLCLGGCPFKALYATELGPVSNGRCPSLKFNIAELLAVFAEAERSRR